MKNRISDLLWVMLPATVLLLLLIPWNAAQGDPVQRTYTYDRAGRLIQADYGNSIYFRYLYDRAGNLTDTRGHRTCP